MNLNGNELRITSNNIANRRLGTIRKWLSEDFRWYN